LTGLLAPALVVALTTLPQPATATVAGVSARAPSLSDRTGLSVTIDSIEPAVLTPGTPLRLSGLVRNDSDHLWSDAQVYLEISEQPATTKGELDQFALTGDQNFGTRVAGFDKNGRPTFAQIGAVRAGEARPYQLDIPYALLPSAVGAPGVYHVAVAVLATPVNGIRDLDADARTDAIVPLESPSHPAPHQTAVTTLIPLTAPVPRHSDGVFVGDGLAAEISSGGRLRNLMDFLLEAPPNSVDVVVDPALVTALQKMSDGYQYIDRSADPETQPQSGAGQQAAAAWLDDFDTVSVNQHIDLMPWANPDTSGLAAARLRGVVDAAVRASLQFAGDRGLTAPVVDWQNNGGTTRRGLAAANRAGARIHVVSQDALPQLLPLDDYPPALATVDTHSVPLTTTVSRSDVAGVPITRTTTALDFRQQMLSEALVRAMGSTAAPTSVIATPFRWNPGVIPTDLNLAGAYGAGFVEPTALSALTIGGPGTTPYVGPVQIPPPHPDIAIGLESAIKRLRGAGRVYTSLLTQGDAAATAFDQQLAEAGSSAWLWQPKRGAAIARQAARAMAAQIRKVTVTGPEFVALSSEKGQFPLTVSNGLDVSVTVNVSVVPRISALRIDPIEPIVLDPGQRRVIEVQTRSTGSGVTSVTARLATTDAHEFGTAWVFDIRATRIGVAIWILLGVLMAALFGGAAIRIIRRVRSGGFQPRGQQPA
jgi:hypothetical protein